MANKRNLHALLILSGVLLVASFSHAATLSGDLLNHFRSSDKTISYDACLLLAEVRLQDSQLATIRKLAITGHDAIKRACADYVVMRHTLQSDDINQFVASMPNGVSVTGLSELHEKSGYLASVSSPLIAMLADVAKTDDKALAKLVSYVDYTDGAVQQTVIDDISAIYAESPTRVERYRDVLRRYMELIKESAGGQCNE